MKQFQWVASGESWADLRQRVLQELCAIIKEPTGIDVSEDMRFEDILLWDSLDEVLLYMEVQDVFDVHIKDECFGTLETVGAVIEYVLRNRPVPGNVE